MTKNRIIGSVAAALLLGWPAAAPAAPGDLDPSFSGDGIAALDMGYADSAGTAVAVQPDGKVVVTGGYGGLIPGPSSNRDWTGNFVVARYNPDGSLDTTFSGDGKQATSFGARDNATAVTVLEDGKILAAGSTAPAGTGQNRFALARYLPNGAPDPSFSGDGKLVLEHDSHAWAVALAVQPDDAVVVAGDGFSGLALARVLPNGTPDPGFGGDGTVDTPIGDANATAVTVQGDGRILVAGYQFYDFNLGTADFLVARYEADGDLDQSWSDDGMQTTDFWSAQDNATAVAVQPNGRVVVGGSSRYNGNLKFALARYHANGTPDLGFQHQGRITADFSASTADAALGLHIAGDGDIWAFGHSGAGFAVSRHNSNGALDPGFDLDGRKTAAFGGPSDAILAVARHGDGTFAATGRQDGALQRVAVGRYDAAADPDTGFSDDGVTSTALGGGRNAFNAGALQVDGKIVAAGWSRAADGKKNFAVVRYRADGTFDPTFGQRTFDFGGDDVADAVAVQPDGKILVAGSDGQGSDFALVRLLPTGARDTSFSGDGLVTLTITPNSFHADDGDGVEALLVQPDQKIVAIGHALLPAGSSFRRDMAAARFNADGTPDATFGGGDGQTTVPFIGSAAADGALVTGGRILMAGSRDGHFALARLMPDGSPDTTFSGDGRTYNLSGATAEAVAVQTDGTFWVAGSPTQDGVLGKYAANGTPAFAFGGGDGRVFTDFGATPRRLYADAMLRQADGRIVLAGVVRHTYEDTDVAIGRFLSDGSPDPAFGDGGGRVTDTGEDGAAHALLRQADGKYVVVGDHGDGDGLVARYLGG